MIGEGTAWSIQLGRERRRSFKLSIIVISFQIDNAADLGGSYEQGIMVLIVKCPGKYPNYARDSMRFAI
jgi:hypothetical protein